MQNKNCRKLETVSHEHCLFLTYHRILPASEVTQSIEPGMYVTPSTFSNHIRFLKKYFDIIDAGQFKSLGVDKFSKKIRRPCCVISFDDGWLDFYQYAWPILEQENVPAIVFLPTKLIGTMEMFWTEKLALIWRNNGLKALTGLLRDHKIIVKKLSSKNIKAVIKSLKGLKYTQIDLLLNDCLKKLDMSKSLKRSFMNWNEVRSLYRSGLVSFGSHTVNHAILTTLYDAEIYDELLLSKQKLIDECVVGDSIPFCYPNGNYTKDIAGMVEEAGYSSAMSCDAGWNTSGCDLFSLKRISLHQDISSTDSLLAYRLAQYL